MAIWTRRRFLKATGAVLGAAAGVAGYARWIEPHWVQVTQGSLKLPGIAPRWHGRTIAFVSDLHVGPRVDSDYLTQWLGWIADRSPDAVLIGGDFMSCLSTEQVENAVEVVRALRPEALPVFASLGNHDYGHRWEMRVIADTLAGELQRAGVTVLRDETTDHDGLAITGLEELWSPCFDQSRAQATIKTSAHGLVLAHNPDVADLPIWAGFQGTIFSGHTHGGQVRVPIYGTPFVPVRNKRFVAGSYPLDDRRNLYISRGLGHSHQVRFLARPQVTMFRVESA